MRFLAIAAVVSVSACSSNTDAPIGRPGFGDDVSSSVPPPQPSASASASTEEWKAPEVACIEMPEPRKMPDKRAGMVELVEMEWIAVYVDPKAKGVKLPPYLESAPYVVLDLGNDMPTPIKGLQFSDNAIEGELVFHKQPFRVRIPYAAVFGYVSHTTQKGGLYADQIPKDALCGVEPPTAP